MQRLLMLKKVVSGQKKIKWWVESQITCYLWKGKSILTNFCFTFASSSLSSSWTSIHISTTVGQNTLCTVNSSYSIQNGERSYLPSISLLGRAKVQSWRSWECYIIMIPCIWQTVLNTFLFISYKCSLATKSLYSPPLPNMHETTITYTWYKSSVINFEHTNVVSKANRPNVIFTQPKHINGIDSPWCLNCR
jgi:hypothetical protein